MAGRFRDEGKQLSDVDAQLAALALRNGFVLLTTDKDFGWVRGLTTETWIEYNQHAAP